MSTDGNFTDPTIKLGEEEMSIDVNFTDSIIKLREEVEKCFNLSITEVPPSEEYCTTTWDGLLCWPNTPPGVTAYLPCVAEIDNVKYDTNQNASRICYENGTWANQTDYGLCSELHTLTSNQILSDEGIIVQSTIYAVGYGFSLTALGLAVWIFLYYKDLRCLRNTIHTNLMCTYILADLMWILSSIQVYVKTDPAICMVLFILLHYLILTNYFWMFVEGLYLYMLVVETFTRENINLRAYLAIGWGIPVIIVIPSCLARAFISDDYEYGLIGHHEGCTWVVSNSSDWIYMTSSIIVLAVNVIFLIMIMWVLITKLRSSNNAETQQYRKATKALLVLIPLLGVTYILFIAGPTEGPYAYLFSYIRAFLLSTQGLMVALLYCFLNTEVQNTVRHHFTRWKESRNLGARRYTCSKDWSPNTRTESVRLCSKHDVMPYRKRESVASENTTMTLVGGNNSSPQNKTINYEY
ncbi:diuretic hormone receptor-like isoform X2 [Rhodnius prolixus]|uniref:Diuretic hormone receptor n=1 Tax=Rhodnius prolixus TaxID=13249 RepID=A0A0K0LFR2_RHOPR|nr:corticotropin releasing factor-related diuretic hormone receptor [Rhodnius prolixus]